jgi:hypothetical protein
MHVPLTACDGTVDVHEDSDCDAIDVGERQDVVPVTVCKRYASPDTKRGICAGGAVMSNVEIEN